MPEHRADRITCPLVRIVCEWLTSQMQQDSAAALRRLRSELARFRGLWPHYEADLQRLGISGVDGLRGRDPDSLAADYCRMIDRPVDPWLSACFTALVRFAETGEAVPWWRVMRARAAEAVAMPAP
jgi:hypothetical protein